MPTNPLSRTVVVDGESVWTATVLGSVVGRTAAEELREASRRGLCLILTERAELLGMSPAGYLAWATNRWRESNRLLPAGED